MWIYSTRTKRTQAKLRPGASSGEFVVTYTEPSPPTDFDTERTRDICVLLVPGDRGSWRTLQILINSMETRLTAAVDVECRAFIWPSLRHGLDFAAARKAATGSAASFGRVIQRLKGDAGFKKIVVIGHSVGARVVLAGLAQLDGEGVDGTILLGGEPAASSLKEGGQYAAAISKAGSLFTYWSPSDKVLGWVGTLLGSHGSIGTRPVSLPGVTDVNAETIYGDHVFHDTHTYADEILHDAARRLNLPKHEETRPFVGFDYLRSPSAS